MGKIIVECKSWKHGWRTGDSAMGKADLLVIRADHAQPKVYMTWEMFTRLVGPALNSHRDQLLSTETILSADEIDFLRRMAAKVFAPPEGH